MARTPDPETEKLTRQVIFMLQPSLFIRFEEACRSQYKTVSEVLRAMILEFVWGSVKRAGCQDGPGEETR